MQFQACSIYILSMLIPFIFNSAAASPFQVCSNSAISLCNTCLLFTHLIQCYFQSSSMFMQLQVSPNSVVSQCFFYIRSILFNSSLTTQSYSRFKVYYFDKFNKFVLFLNILTNYFTVSHCTVFLFCIYNFRTKSQFHVKWICRNKFIIIIIIIIIIKINC